MSRKTRCTNTARSANRRHQDQSNGHQHQENTAGASIGATQSALLTHIEFQIAIESSNSYRNGQNQRSSGKCRTKVVSIQRTPAFRFHANEDGRDML